MKNTSALSLSVAALALVGCASVPTMTLPGDVQTSGISIIRESFTIAADRVCTDDGGLVQLNASVQLDSTEGYNYNLVNAFLNEELSPYVVSALFALEKSTYNNYKQDYRVRSRLQDVHLVASGLTNVVPSQLGHLVVTTQVERVAEPGSRNARSYGCPKRTR